MLIILEHGKELINHLFNHLARRLADKLDFALAVIDLAHRVGDDDACDRSHSLFVGKQAARQLHFIEQIGPRKAGND